jgi:hypothetical protein
MTRRVHKSTFFSHTHPDEGGRFAVSDQPPRHVVGSTPAPRYPAGPNWSADPTGVEPPLGVPIDQMEPVGEAFEVAKSLAEACDDTELIRSGPLNDSPSGDGPALSQGHSSSGSSKQQRRRRPLPMRKQLED